MTNQVAREAVTVAGEPFSVLGVPVMAIPRPFRGEEKLEWLCPECEAPVRAEQWSCGRWHVSTALSFWEAKTRRHSERGWAEDTLRKIAEGHDCAAYSEYAERMKTLIGV